MINYLVAEISSYLQHQDYSLAVRRLLDVCLDINKPELVRKAIDLSRVYNRVVKDKQESPSEFINHANELIQQISSENLISPTSELLVSVDQVSKTYKSGSFTINPVSFKVS